MFTLPEEFVSYGKGQVESLANLTHITLTGLERLADLQLRSAKTLANENVKAATSALEIKDLQELSAFQSNFAKPGIEGLTAYARGLYDIAQGAQAETQKFLEAQMAEFNKAALTSLDKVVKSAPAGSDLAVATVKSAMTAANSAYDTFSKAVKQAAEITEAGMTAAGSATAPVAGTKKKAA